MADQQKDIVERCVTTTLADIEKYAPEEFEKLEKDPTIKQSVVQAARDAATEHLKLAEEFRTKPTENIEERLSKHLPKHRVDLIKTGLQVPTYQLNIARRSDGHHWVDIIRDGKPFMESIKLDTAASIEQASWIQIASIIVEAVLLVLQAVGIKLHVSKQVIERTAKEIVSVVESSSQLQKAVKALEEAAKNGSIGDIAKAIFYLIKESHSASILWKVIKSLCSNMSTLDWIKTAAIVSAEIIAAIFSGGAALIAKVVLALNSAYEFIKKLTNLRTLKELKQD